MSLRLVSNKNNICKIQGEYYAGEYYEEKKELDKIHDLRMIIRDRYDKLVYTETILTKREESLRKEEKHKKHEKTYQEFIESLRQIRKEREDKYKKIQS